MAAGAGRGTVAHRRVPPSPSETRPGRSRLLRLRARGPYATLIVRRTSIGGPFSSVQLITSSPPSRARKVNSM